MTVHPLGGCCIGDEAGSAVVDSTGQVFSGPEGNKVHSGLYVCDGSVVPMPLGTNPALTISALAEHIAAGRRATAARAGRLPPQRQSGNPAVPASHAPSDC
jgi:cholesterol oxidase